MAKERNGIYKLTETAELALMLDANVTVAEEISNTFYDFWRRNGKPTRKPRVNREYRVSIWKDGEHIAWLTSGSRTITRACVTWLHLTAMCTVPCPYSENR